MYRLIFTLSFALSLTSLAKVSEALSKQIHAAAATVACDAPADVRKLLVLSKSTGFVHKSTDAGIVAIQKLAEKTGAFSVELTDAPEDFTLTNLQQYDALVLNNNTGIENFLRAAVQRQALEQYVQEGGGLVAIHAASDGGWDQYTEMIGGRFAGHPWGAGDTWSFVNEDRACACTNHYPELFRFKDEVYSYNDYDRNNVRVLLALDFTDSATTQAHARIEDVPVSWIRKIGDGRLFYTNFGHNISTWHDTDFLTHLLKGILIATGDLAADFAPIVEKPASPRTAEVQPLTETEALKTFEIQDGYTVELSAGDELLEEPVHIVWDGNGAMYVAQMETYMDDIYGSGEKEPICRVLKLVDRDWDGVYETRTVFAEGLVMPRKLICLDGTVIIGETDTNDLYAYEDTDGDGVSDRKERVYEGGKRGGNMEHQPQGFIWNLDNVIAGTWMGFRYVKGRLEKARFTYGIGGQWGITQTVTGQTIGANGGHETGAMHFQVPHEYGGMELPGERGPTFLEVWPIDNIPDSQGGAKRLRDDNTLNHMTCVSGGEIYRGGILGDLENDLFLAEPVGRMIRRTRIEKKGGMRILHNHYPGKEFIRSTDPNFRPVSLATGPDGQLYIVDMYRGIIQQAQWVGKGSYLYRIVKAYGLDQHTGRGRIYRVGRAGAQRYPKPKMLDQSAMELVPYLAHANAWQRLTAQKLIVVRGGLDVVPKLREMADTHANPVARLHALWTLDGLAQTEWDQVHKAISDPDPRIREAAIRLATPWFQKDQALMRSVLPLKTETDSQVLVQIMNTARRVGDLETRALLFDTHRDGHYGLAEMEKVLLKQEKAARIREEKLQKLEGAKAAKLTAGKAHYDGLCLSCHGQDGMGTKAGTLILGAPLPGSARVMGDKNRLIALALKGLQGPVDGKNYGIMMPLASYSDAHIADVLSYIRSSWQNDAELVEEAEVAEVRAALKETTGIYTLSQLYEEFPNKLTAKKKWRFTSSIPSSAFKHMTDGALKKRWGTKGAQAPGQWLGIQLPAPAEVTGLIMDHGSSLNDYPRQYEVHTSTDGDTWQKQGDFEGTPNVSTAIFPAVEAAHLKIVNTTPMGTVPGWWSIHELEITERFE